MDVPSLSCGSGAEGTCLPLSGPQRARTEFRVSLAFSFGALSPAQVHGLFSGNRAMVLAPRRTWHASLPKQANQKPAIALRGATQAPCPYGRWSLPGPHVHLVLVPCSCVWNAVATLRILCSSPSLLTFCKPLVPWTGQGCAQPVSGRGCEGEIPWSHRAPGSMRVANIPAGTPGSSL